VQLLHGRVDAQAREPLLRREVEHAAELAFELRQRQPREFGQRLHAHGFAVARFHAVEHAAQARVARMASVRLREVARDADQSRHRAAVAQRRLAREAPARCAIGEHVRFELVLDRMAAQHASILRGVRFAEPGREQLRRRASDHVLAAAQAEAGDKREVGVGVAAGGVLEEEHDVGQAVEQRLQRIGIHACRRCGAHRRIMPISASRRRDRG